MEQITKPHFWHTGVVYQIYPRSFRDANNDGMGDLAGIIEKLPYLQKLGIKMIWLSPVFKSPQKDNGYDVSDYCDIDPIFGTIDEMKTLISEANKRGLKIIMDLVINHTSTAHPWFQSALDPASPYHDYYIWRPGKNGKQIPPNNWSSNFSGTAWEYVPSLKQYYLHLYAIEQADLNWQNPAVYDEVKKILTFWLDLGVSGFRCDVINQIYKTSLENGKRRFFQTGKEHYLNQPGNHAILKQFRQDVFSQYDCVVIGENFGVSYADGQEFLNQELDMFFQFDHMTVNNSFVPVFKKKYQPAKFLKVLRGWQENCAWNATYLENHDQHRSLSKFGNPKYFHYESASMLATLLLTLRGTPFIYQGEEIGMTDCTFAPEEIDDVAAKYVDSLMRKIPILGSKKIRGIGVNTINRDHARTPMQWNDQPLAGFSQEGTKPWLKVNPNYLQINVEKNLKETRSVYHYYQALISLRNKNSAFTLGTIKFLSSPRGTLFFHRQYDQKIFEIRINAQQKVVNTSPRTGEIILNNYSVEKQGSLLPYQITISLLTPVDTNNSPIKPN